MKKELKEEILDKLESNSEDEVKFKKIEMLSDKAIELKRKLIGIVDKIYELDELEGDRINELLNDEKQMRS